MYKLVQAWKRAKDHYWKVSGNPKSTQAQRDRAWAAYVRARDAMEKAANEKAH